MKKCTIAIFLILFLVSCGNESTTRVATQIIENESVSFDYSDFESLENNRSYKKFKVGELNITSGRIVCTDPLYRELGFPQNWKVRTGNYPVTIYIGNSGNYKGRIAYAEIKFSQEIPFRWEYSLIPNIYLSDELERKINGRYPVENGLSSFSDYETWKKYNLKIKEYYSKNVKGNFYKDILEPLFKVNSNIPPYSRGEDWINYVVDNSKNANIIMFGSGWGDGLYPRYVAIDKSGNPVKLITDFINRR